MPWWEAITDTIELSYSSAQNVVISLDVVGLCRWKWELWVWYRVL